MQFSEVTEFIPGTKYRIVSNVSHGSYEGIYVSTNYLHRFKHVPTFKNLEYVNFIPNYHTFYEPIFQRDRIQSDMEERALQLILKNITGDENFTYIV